MKISKNSWAMQAVAVNDTNQQTPQPNPSRCVSISVLLCLANAPHEVALCDTFMPASSGRCTCRRSILMPLVLFTVYD